MAFSSEIKELGAVAHSARQTDSARENGNWNDRRPVGAGAELKPVISKQGPTSVNFLNQKPAGVFGR